MDVHPVDGHAAGRTVEVLILQLAQRAAVHRVGVLRTEAGNVEQIRAAADFLVRREADAHRAVLRRVRRHEPGRQGHDFRHAGLVVRAQHAVAAGDDHILALQGGQEVKAVDDHAVFQRDGLPVIVFDHLGMGRAQHAVGGVHVGDEAHPGGMIALGGNGAIDVAVLVHPGVSNAQGLHFVHQHTGQRPLVRAGGAGLAGFHGGGLHLNVAQETILHGHGYLSLYQ